MFSLGVQRFPFCFSSQNYRVFPGALFCDTGLTSTLGDIGGGGGNKFSGI